MPSAAVADVVAAEPQPAVEAAAPAEEAAAVPESASASAAGAPRKVGTFRGIAFAPIHAPKRRFRAAQQQCADMNAGGDQGWRMPTLAELHVLAIGRAIDRGVYWSGTEAETFGKRALVWSEKKSAAMPITKAWRGGRALCVRDAAP
jgi:hypothetical protein